ncbi:hypothetical protein SCWH03_20840 [Streptomyces pacificus]|uniref:Uncharacterized protein n=1 Tax=Streptomyces pacificus TaxID=2705029 RepID=A0A6A0ASN8_9ACTN|nr:hypothetical protein SCWH03_20840 [Streptomyces pacificus]
MRVYARLYRPARNGTGHSAPGGHSGHWVHFAGTREQSGAHRGALGGREIGPVRGGDTDRPEGGEFHHNPLRRRARTTAGANYSPESYDCVAERGKTLGRGRVEPPRGMRAVLPKR